MGKKQLTVNDLWAPHIIRVKTSTGEKIAAFVRRKYSDDDIDTKDPGHYIGVKEVDDVPMITDNDPESETYTKRIPDPEAEPSSSGIKKFNESFTKENIAKYKKLVGNTVQGKTQLVYLFRDRAFTADDEEEFWTLPMEEVRKILTNRKQIVQLENPPK